MDLRGNWPLPLSAHSPRRDCLCDLGEPAELVCFVGLQLDRHDAIGLGITPDEADAAVDSFAVDSFRYRRDNLRGIIDRNRREFRGVTQWSLFL